MQKTTIKHICQAVVTLLIVSQLAGCPLFPPRGSGGHVPAGAPHLTQ